MIRSNRFCKIFSNEREYVPHRANVATRWDPLAGGALEGTTKNAHVQEKREIFAKKIDAIYLIDQFSSVGSLLT